MCSLLLSLVLVASSARASSITMDNIQEKLRLLNPVLMMTEELFRAENRNSCLEKMFCLLETSLDSNDAGNPLQHYSQILTNSKRDLEMDAFEEVLDLLERYPRVSNAVNAIVLGQRTLNSSACHDAYSQCKITEKDVIALATMLSDDNAQTFAGKSRGLTLNSSSKRNTYCDTTGLACGVAGGGCALCSVVTSGGCSLWCLPEVGAVCAGTGIGCSLGSLFG